MIQRRATTAVILTVASIACFMAPSVGVYAAPTATNLTVNEPRPGGIAANFEEACAQLDDPTIRGLMDMAEFRLLVACGRTHELGLVSSPSQITWPNAGPLATDVQVNNSSGESGSSQTQSETSIVLNENTGTLCSAWNDSWGYYHSAGITGFANSTDGGATFTDHGGLGTTAYGDPSLVWRRSDGKFYIASLHSSGGLGVWRSDDDCNSFVFAANSSSGFSDDKELLAVDNNPTSPYYGRIYQAWTDFGTGGSIVVNHSDNGTNWSTKVTLSTSIGNVQGAWPAIAQDGTVYVAWIRWDPYYSGPITVEAKKSTDGGASFTAITSPMSGKVNPYANTPTGSCGRPALNGNIRYLPSPQISVSPNGDLHAVYSYDPDGFNVGDVVNVYYRRSTNQGASWGTEILLNDDGTTKDQFFPSLSAGPSGRIVVSWYDRRNDVGNLLIDYFQRISYDGGATFQPSTKLSDVSSPVYLDPGFAACYHGDYDQQVQDLSTAYVQWADDRNVHSAHNDPDVWLESTILGPDFTLDVSPVLAQVCAPANGVFTATIGSLLGFVNPVTLSQTGAPAGTSVNFDVNPVTPPGSSTMTISNMAAGAPGLYTIQVTGTAGTTSHAKSVSLELETAVPGPVSLTSPANGAIDISVTPILAWTAATQAKTYHLEIATDPAFTNVVYVQDVTTTSHAVTTALQNLTLYYWRVTPNNFCGTGPTSATFNFTTRGAPRILLVDDDDNAPDVRSYYTGALTALGYNYDVWDTLNSDNEPSASALAPYTSVIWFTGDSIGGFAGPGAAGEAAISSYLDDGPHCFMISSQDYHADRGQTSLMTNYLGANFVVENVGHTSVRGQGLFNGLGPYSLTYPFTNRSDRVNPIRGASDPAFKGKKFAGVTKLTSAYLTGFLGFPIEAIATDADRQAVIGKFLEQTICN